MKRSYGALLVLLTPLALTFCDDKDFPNFVVTPTTPGVRNAAVAILDQCDSTTFNAALGPGTCTKAGNVTFAQFNAELAANKSVAAWRFDPNTLNISLGGQITATNQGGEIHTFTEVENFGGGINPALNQASGNLVPAPECTVLSAADSIKPGGTFKTDAATTIGTEKYQCCIHPWMRATATVSTP